MQQLEAICDCPWIDADNFMVVIYLFHSLDARYPVSEAEYAMPSGLAPPERLNVEDGESLGRVHVPFEIVLCPP